MKVQILARMIITLQLVIGTLSADFILRAYAPTCTVLISSSDPIKVEVKVPSIVNQAESDHVALSLINLKTNKITKQQRIEAGSLFRQNFYLEPNHIYNLCFEFKTARQLEDNAFIVIGFWAEESFESMIGQIKIPPELLGKENLRNIYETGLRMREFIGRSAEGQRKEREGEDRLVNLSSHKTKRIVSITIMECVVIVASGVYQIWALRKFMISKDLY